jgi:hypothetical protein
MGTLGGKDPLGSAVRPTPCSSSFLPFSPDSISNLRKLKQLRHLPRPKPVHIDINIHLAQTQISPVQRVQSRTRPRRLNIPPLRNLLDSPAKARSKAIHCYHLMGHRELNPGLLRTIQQDVLNAAVHRTPHVISFLRFSPGNNLTLRAQIQHSKLHVSCEFKLDLA